MRSIIYFLSFLGYCCIYTATSFAQENQENLDQTQQELESVNTAISSIANWLEEASSQQSVAEQELREAEREVTRVSRAVSQLQSTIAENQTQLVQLQNQQQTLNDQVENTRATLQQAIRVAYLTNDQSFLKMLLNHEDISESSRMLHYSRVFSETQLSNIANYQTTLEDLAGIDASLTDTLADLNNQQQQLQSEASALESAKEERSRALVTLNNEIATRSTELAELENNQAQLEALVAEIRRAMEGVSSFADVPPFVDARGSLPQPVNGSISTQFGSRYGDGNLTRQGITISTETGSPVQAVHAGRVVFSDWLRGSGLLVIVDHGNGYLSLYGANQSLTQEAGNWVDVGDTIATSGDGGPQGSPGIYFEIRHEGQAQNPQNWLR